MVRLFDTIMLQILLLGSDLYRTHHITSQLFRSVIK